jgi:primosomal protein N' (replication factor Y)
LDLPSLPEQTVKLAHWLQTYYPSSIGVVTQQFLPKELSNIHRLVPDKPVQEEKIQLPKQTSEQDTVIKQIRKPRTYIIHGETGSGKTRVYIELAMRTLKEGRSVIMLVPEIGLTSQLTEEFRRTFGQTNVVVTHSQLTEKERKLRWTEIISATKPLVIIGPRSALFSPIKNIGLIILDEAHEASYKQDQSPHYHATRVAAQLADMSQAILILGSATPSVLDYFLAEQKQKPILRMVQLAQSTTKYETHMQVIDIKDRSHFTRSPYLSDELLASIEKALVRGEQSLLFLNRRGTARVVLCDQCGWQAVCPHCNLPLTYHGDLHVLRCHTCGHAEPAMNSCPVCKKPNIVLKSIGTKAVFDEISALFPQSKVQRFDTDNKKSERIEQHYTAVKSGDVDILIGTQILVKGFDLPRLSVVGVVIADTSLSFPDYTAQERTYQLLRQAIGRVGRGHRDSVVIMQTYDPVNPVITSVTTNAWRTFYEQELREREKFKFPPYYFLLKLTVRRASAASSQKTAQKFIDLLCEKSLRVIIDGPAPSVHEKIGDKFQWQVVIKARDRKELLKVIDLLPSGWAYDIDPLNLL